MNRLLNLRRREGFTLIELMIVVAIIGILAAIAIPNFLRFQLRSKAGEGKVNLAAIRSAEEGYFAEFGTYVTGTASPSAWTSGSAGTQKIPWADAGGFDVLGWAPEGHVYYQYAVDTGSGSAPFVEYLAEAQSDIDGDGTDVNFWGYAKPAAGATAVSYNGGLSSGACAGTGTWRPVPPPSGTKDMLETVGPCAAGMGQSVF
jgi:type IV pilus assembly protein PilA